MFVTQGPVAPSSPLFVGRANELALAEEWLKAVQCVGTVLGARQTGKTSFFFRLREALRGKYAFAFVNLEAVLEADVEKCFGYVAQEIQEQLEGFLESGSIVLPNDDRSFLAFLSSVSKAARTVRIAVLLDEVGALPQSTAIKFASTVRAAFNNRLVKRELERYVFVLAGSTDMLNLTTGRNSPLKNVTESIYLGDLSRAESDALLREGFEGVPERVSEEVQREIYVWASGHPYWTQLLGAALMGPALPIDGARIRSVVEGFLQKEDKNLPHLRRGLPEGRRELWSIVDRLLEEATVPFSRADTAVAELELLGLIKEDGGRCVLRNRIYREALERWRGLKAVALAPTTKARGGLENAHALLIGVGDYLHPAFPNLPATVRDAQAVATLLSDPERGGYVRERVTVLTSREATAAAVRVSFKNLASATDADSTVFLFFSGHGGRQQQADAWQTFLCPREADPDDLAGTAISGDEFSALVADLPARRVLVILDACHAGGSATPKAAGGRSPEWKAGLPESYYDALGSGSGRIVIASSKDDQYSFVRGELSLFTHYLTEALDGKAAVRGDDLVHVLDVFHFVNEAVRTDRPEQIPILKVKDLDLNYAIAVHRASSRGGALRTKDGAPPIARIRDQIVQDPLAGAAELRAYLSSRADVAPRRVEVDLKRAELRQLQHDLELFGPSHDAKAAQSRVVYFLLRICAELEETS